MGAFRFVAGFLVVLGLEIGGVFALNVIANPHAEFPMHVLPALVPDRLTMKVQRYDAMPSAPQTIVFGSSRSHMVAPRDLEALGHPAAFNFANGGEVLPDAVAIFRYMVARHQAPKEIFYGMDEDKMQVFLGPRWEARTSPQIAPHTGSPASPRDYVRAMIASYSFDYVRDAGRSLYYAVAGYPPALFTIDADGLVRYPGYAARMASGTYDLAGAIERDVTTQAHFYDTLDRANPRQVATLRSFVDEVRGSGARITLFVVPLHPRFLRALNDSTFGPFMDDALRALRSLCGPDVRVFNFLRIESFGGDSTEFYDARHMTPANARRMLEKMNSGAGNLCTGAGAPASR